MNQSAYAFITRAALITAVASSAPACSSPTQASVVDPGGPQITCPAVPSPTQTLDGQPVAVSYLSPTVIGGAVPLNGPTCTPASGTTFPQGMTNVTCLVSDAKARPSSCSFMVTVLGPPMLTLTRFFGFGDSMTKGEIPSEGDLMVARRRAIDPYLNYTADLTRALANRYRTQQPGVDNQGVSGESTAYGLLRLPTTLGMGYGYQVMLLLEGANDIPAGPSSFAPAVSNLQAMIDLAKGAGIKVFLANLPPENPDADCGGSNGPPGCIFRASGAPYVAPFNALLPALAAAEQIPFVDVYSAFNGDVTTLIDVDGLHPTAAGYTVIANTFFTSIQKTLEIPVTSGTPSRTSLVTLLRRR